jgi:hypothetical protein
MMLWHADKWRLGPSSRVQVLRNLMLAGGHVVAPSRFGLGACLSQDNWRYPTDLELKLENLPAG